MSFGESITNIGVYAFRYCTALKNVTFKSNLRTIGENVFNGCEGLETVFFNEGVKTIGSTMFQNCYNLTYVTIPSTVSSISTNPFLRCYSLQFIKIRKENSYYSNYENDGVLYDKEITKLISYPNGNNSETFKIPDSVTSIESNAFDSCKNLLSISFGANVNIIKDSAFNNCLITNVIISNTVTEIQSMAFYSCKELETLIIGKNVKSFGADAFSYCSSLKCIYFYGETSPSINGNCFNGINEIYVMVYETYQNEKFGELNITKEIIDGCLPMPTLIFTQSNTFAQSNSLTQSNLLMS